MSLIVAKDLSKTYSTGAATVEALKHVSFEIEAASFVSFIGPSASGKTTLLNLLGGLDRPTSGSLAVAGEDVSRLDRLAAYCSQCHALPRLSVCVVRRPAEDWIR